VPREAIARMPFLGLDAGLWLIFATCAFVMVLVYSLFFGDSKFHQSGVIGWIHLRVAALMSAPFHPDVPPFFRRILGQRLFGYAAASINYCVNTKNPLLPLFYLAFMLSGFAIFYLHGWPLITDNHMFVPPLFKQFTLLLFASCLAVWAVCCVSDPGVITADNHKFMMQQYAAHELLFPANKDCPTCHFVKPARSKHCRVCNHCVAKFDHHCPWIFNCVGQRNIRHFLCFLAMHALLCTYGFALIALTLLGWLLQQGISVGVPLSDGSVVSASWMFKYTAFHNGPLLGLALALIVIAVVLCMCVASNAACSFPSQPRVTLHSSKTAFSPTTSSSSPRT
jgi:hypothetical protein